jgi:hypothetical protein
LVLPWLAIAIAAVALPWGYYLLVVGGSFSDALLPKALWDALWPILIGGVLTVALRRWKSLLPRIPPGDMLVFGERAMPAVSAFGAAMEGFDLRLRQWPVAGVLFLVLTIVLVGAMLAGR